MYSMLAEVQIAQSNQHQRLLAMAKVWEIKWEGRRRGWGWLKCRGREGCIANNYISNNKLSLLTK